MILNIDDADISTSASVEGMNEGASYKTRATGNNDHKGSEKN
jgi:hypothetical protein